MMKIRETEQLEFISHSLKLIHNAKTHTRQDYPNTESPLYPYQFLGQYRQHSAKCTAAYIDHHYSPVKHCSYPKLDLKSQLD